MVCAQFFWGFLDLQGQFFYWPHIFLPALLGIDFISWTFLEYHMLMLNDPKTLEMCSGWCGFVSRLKHVEEESL